MTNVCPVCGATNNIYILSRRDLITMQNYIYPNLQDALNTLIGQFELYCCQCCGMAHNESFDSSLVTYDKNYNVHIPSAIFDNYYKEIAAFLCHHFSLEDGLIIDIGCGDGTLLKLLCSLYPNVRGLGIDPTFEPDNQSSSPLSNVQFIQDVFREKYVTEKPSLILCRHAFDQIEYPLAFLQSIDRATAAFENTPFFIEVADLSWIIKNNTYWDFCYERCSYFTTESIKITLSIAGFEVENIRKAFNDTYLWAFGTITRERRSLFEQKCICGDLKDYAANEKKLFSKTKNKLQTLKAEGNKIAVWGMATKGVVFCNLIDAELQLFDFCIDISRKKINCFVPRTGHRIDAPEKLREAAESKFVVIVMNPNYLNEINEICRRLNLNPKFIDANGNDLPGGDFTEKAPPFLNLLFWTAFCIPTLQN